MSMLLFNTVAKGTGPSINERYNQHRESIIKLESNQRLNIEKELSSRSDKTEVIQLCIFIIAFLTSTFHL